MLVWFFRWAREPLISLWKHLNNKEMKHYHLSNTRPAKNEACFCQHQSAWIRTCKSDKTQHWSPRQRWLMWCTRSMRKCVQNNNIPGKERCYSAAPCHRVTADSSHRRWMIRSAGELKVTVLHTHILYVKLQTTGSHKWTFSHSSLCVCVAEYPPLI